MNKINNIVNKTAHFFCVNSEAINFYGLQGRMTLIYFLFLYGQKSNKQHYTDFAFELLEGNLADILTKFQSTNVTPSFELGMLEVGWSLQKFVQMRFFESEDLSEILRPFDEMAIEKAKTLKEKPLCGENIILHILIAQYLSEIYSAKQIDTPESEGIRNLIDACLTKLFDSIQLFKDYPNHSLVTKWIFYKYLNNTNNNIVKSIYEETNFIYTEVCNNLFIDLLWPPNSIGRETVIATNKKKLYDQLKKSLDSNVKMLYEDPQGNHNIVLLKTLLYGCVLLKGNSIEHKEFLAYGILHMPKKENLVH